MNSRGIQAVSVCAATVCWLKACETVKRLRLAAGAARAPPPPSFHRKL